LRTLHLIWLPWLWLLAVPVLLGAQPLIRHDMQIVLQPEIHQLQVTDTITLPASSGEAWHFFLHAGLQPRSLTPEAQLVRLETPPPPAVVPLVPYRVALPPGTRTWRVQYAGAISHPLQQHGDSSPSR
jgi:hypothetical protein